MVFSEQHTQAIFEFEFFEIDLVSFFLLSRLTRLICLGRLTGYDRRIALFGGFCLTGMNFECAKDDKDHPS